MTLLELRPHFLKIVDEKTYQQVDTIGEADGVMFACPLCYRNKGSLIGVHSVFCWRPHVPQCHRPVPGRWEFQGSGMQDLTLVAGSSSILLTGGCKAHFFIRNGQIDLC